MSKSINDILTEYDNIMENFDNSKYESKAELEDQVKEYINNNPLLSVIKRLRDHNLI